MKKQFSSTATFNIRKLAVILLAVGFATSCTKGEESELKVTFPGGLAYALPAPATSCAFSEPKDLPANSITYKNVTLDWANTTDSVYIIAMKIEFKSPNLDGGSYTCTIAGDELGEVFASTSTGLPWDGSLYQPVTGPPAIPGRLTITNSCSVSCGNVPFKEGTPSTTAIGTVSVIGIQRSPTGEEKPVKGQTQIKMTYGGF